ncbi:hypothetical protein J6590_015088 [Homalodisca vitripennis]|nr:hypothetical protein J6590_015088 [Homalodisca vitripennis]
MPRYYCGISTKFPVCLTRISRHVSKQLRRYPKALRSEIQLSWPPTIPQIRFHKSQLQHFLKSVLYFRISAKSGRTSSKCEFKFISKLWISIINCRSLRDRLDFLRIMANGGMLPVGGKGDIHDTFTPLAPCRVIKGHDVLHIDKSPDRVLARPGLSQTFGDNVVT